MMKIWGGLLALCGVLALSAPAFTYSPPLVIAIQPFGRVDSKIITEVQRSILAQFEAKVDIWVRQEMPERAYYAPRKRYRAEKILTYLDGLIGERSTKVLGLTSVDISTGDEAHADWGIIGLGALEGASCVVSTARLQKNGTPEKLHARLATVVYHELGHTFGLNHCPHEGCVMEDAKGTIKTIDRCLGTFCPECRKQLSGRLKSASPITQLVE